MKIYSGIFRGMDCEFGIVDGTSGQMYITLTPKGTNAKKIVSALNEKTLRKVLDLPSSDEDGTNFGFGKVEDAIQWVFMFDRQNTYTQMEYVDHMCQKVEALYQYGIKKKIFKPAKATKQKK